MVNLSYSCANIEHSGTHGINRDVISHFLANAKFTSTQIFVQNDSCGFGIINYTNCINYCYNHTAPVDGIMDMVWEMTSPFAPTS